MTRTERGSPAETESLVKRPFIDLLALLIYWIGTLVLGVLLLSSAVYHRLKHARTTNTSIGIAAIRRN
ncbi:MAG TPA: hypothetical protein VMT88_11385 [Actinomycetes bacterium]|nr:hypothetical protein [Actinomycetes bacterium]